MQKKNNVLLEMRQIDKRFPGTHALNNVDFSLRKGEIHALIGQNGSGKSTLMNILSGSLPSDSGEILLHGEKKEFRTPEQAIENGIGMVRQELSLIPELTISENIYFGRFPKQRGCIDWKTLHKDGQEAISVLSDELNAKQAVRELSVAQQQLVEITRVLAYNTEVVIMDEPTASLNDEEVQSLFEIIHKIVDQGVSIIYISHRLDEIMHIADRVTVLRDGLLIGTLEGDEIKDKDQLVSMMINVQSSSYYRHDAARTPGDIALATKDLCMENKLKDINLELRKGEVVGIAGLMGSGRTELLKTLFGVYRPTKGTITVDETSFEAMNPKQAVALGMAYMSEDRKDEGLLLDMSISDNVVYSSFDKMTRWGILKVQEQKAIVKELGQRLRLKAGSMQSIPRELSGGNQQKVVIAKWLCADSDIILMDEPTRGIDVGAKEEIYNLVSQLADSGKSILFVSSELEEVQRVSDRVLILRDGEITKELPANSTVEEMMKYAV